MVKENQNTKLLINSGLSIGESGVDVTKRGRCWYIGWFILALITLLAQLFFLAWVVMTALYIATNVSSWPLYDNQHDAKGIIAIGMDKCIYIHILYTLRPMHIIYDR